jgi:16S rRNA G1207 methylase RsmC
MATNIEKLAEQINALTDYDPMALECTEATISQAPGERRICLQSFLETAVFHIDFDQVLSL